ncbi:hypothetical protein Pan14r_27230 [Crateriforma conspicua]|uniref:Uncharacterized protein n=1 Tax=Crateriforma conspicua TaxID=2527996 RepID=A0A5C5Y433_9PLAN|nr:hypothetical protein Pan14r_27230 [Crateriforma conspicua]
MGPFCLMTYPFQQFISQLDRIGMFQTGQTVTGVACSRGVQFQGGQAGPPFKRAAMDINML